MSEQPTHAMLVRADDGLHLLPACTARKCAERTVTFVTGADVLGIVELYPEPIRGVQFWQAVQLGNAPKASADSASAWRPIAEAPRDGRRIMLMNAENGECATCKWLGFGTDKWANWPYIHGHPTHWSEVPHPESHHVD